MRHRLTLILSTACCLCLVSLTGCAPEGSETIETIRPGQIGAIDKQQSETPQAPDSTSGKKGSGEVATDEDLGEIEGRVPVETEKSHALPSSFPVSDVPIPATAQIDNAGERSNGSWFVVLKYDSLADAKAGFDELATSGSFTIVSEDGSDIDFSSTLEKDSLTVEVLGFTDEVAAYLNLDVSVTP